MEQHTTHDGIAGRSTRVSTFIKAPREDVYRACLDPDALASWRVPDNMTGSVHRFDAREGGAYRMSLVYLDPASSPGGKSSADTDTFVGRFVELIPDQKIVEEVAFESPDPTMSGVMRITTTFADVEEGTEVTLICDAIPPGIRLEDNELGTRQSLRKLAALFE